MYSPFVWLRFFLVIGILSLTASCAVSPDKQTLASLRNVEPQLEEVEVANSLEKAMEGYLSFLDQTSTNGKTPEALRRLADLRLEDEFGTIVNNSRPAGDMERPQSSNQYAALDSDLASNPDQADASSEPEENLSEEEEDFVARASSVGSIEATEDQSDLLLPGETDPVASNSAGPLQAIETYKLILNDYPYYERNDQVLYQMARAYDEIGETEEAVAVLERLIREYPDSRYMDEVYFRRGEFYFVRKKYLDAEESYAEIVRRGPSSYFYELGQYKLGWTFYKQDFYEEALHHYLALLDYKLSIGYDFDQTGEDDDDVRVADTFRVVSLSFSNLGGPEVLSEYFTTYGNRNYEDRIYQNLGEFYFEKRRFSDAARVYKSFVEQYPLNKVAPHFSMRITEIYTDGGFPQLVVESKKDFSRRYSLSAEYWQHYDIEAMPEVISFLKTNLQDLAEHYHAMYLDTNLQEFQGENYAEALLWYGEFLSQFPGDEETPAINYQLADLHLEHKQYALAAREYERTAYDYPVHEQSAAAGYAAVFAHRENLAIVREYQQLAAKQATVESSLRFVNTFPLHEHADTVLGNAVTDLYAMHDYQQAIDAGLKLIEQYPESDKELQRASWEVVAHSYFELEQFVDAEQAYLQVLSLVPKADESYQALVENLAASIYQQAEIAKEAGEYASAADHFLRIKSIAPTSEIRPAAEYDAAVSLMELQDWSRASQVLREFRSVHQGHQLQPEVTRQLAYVYLQAGEFGRAADEYVQVAKDTEDKQVQGDTLLVAADLYIQAENVDSALAIYREYVDTFPEPLEQNVETRYSIAEILLEQQKIPAYRAELEKIVQLDADAGSRRTDRTRYLAAISALVFAEDNYENFASWRLTLPFDKSLAEKQRRMGIALNKFEQLVDYQVGEVTAASTYYMAEIYWNFSNSLLESERPEGLADMELLEYELVLEEEAYPFEERAIEVHEANMELISSGMYNQWIEKSLGQLAGLVPGRYAKSESSAGYIDDVEFYAYRSPLVEQLTAQASRLSSGQPETEGTKEEAPTIVETHEAVQDAF